MVADGYKETEIGVIPVEWDVVRLEDIVKKLQSGGTPLSTNSDFYDGDIPFVKIDDITRSGKYLVNTKVAITQNGLDSSSAWLVPINSILYSMYASIGFLSINKVEVSTNQAIMNIIPDGSKITLEFLYQYLLDLKGKIDKFIDQTTQKNLNAQKVKNFKIPLPPLKEQEKIADILSTADDKIDVIASQIEKAEIVKKGLLQKLLSEGIGHSKFKDSELGKIPESWEMKKLKEVVNINPNSLTNSTNPNFEIEYIDISSIVETGTISETNIYKFSEAPSRARRIINKNDVLLSTVRPYLKSFSIVKDDKDNLICSTGYAVLRAKEQTYYEFIYQFLLTDIFMGQVDTMLVGSNYPAINSNDVKNIKFSLPPLEEQKQIADILSTADEKVEILKAKKQMYETLKKGLLQKLLSGEVRV